VGGDPYDNVVVEAFGARAARRANILYSRTIERSRDAEEPIEPCVEHTRVGRLLILAEQWSHPSEAPLTLAQHGLCVTSLSAYPSSDA
jgi:hypothetical protein